MDISELITIIRVDYLSDTFDGWETASTDEKNDQFLWSDDSLLRYINEAQRQACNRTDFIYGESMTITPIADKQEYKLSNLVTVLEEVKYQDKIIHHISKEERDRYIRDWRTDKGMGSDGDNLNLRYWVRGRSIFFSPIPDGSITDKIFLSTYSLPAEPIVSVSDELVIPEEFHRDLVWWVLYEAYSKQDADGYDKQRGVGYYAQFEQVFGQYVSSEVRLNQLQEPKHLSTRPVSYLPTRTSSRYDRRNFGEEYD